MGFELTLNLKRTYSIIVIIITNIIIIKIKEIKERKETRLMNNSVVVFSPALSEYFSLLTRNNKPNLKLTLIIFYSFN